MKIYFAAVYGRHEEMLDYAKQIIRESSGKITVTSRWIEGEHQYLEGVVSGQQSAQFAENDLEDLLDADMLVFFGEGPDSTDKGRGGRHTEFGAAIMYNMLYNIWLPQADHKPFRICIVGYRENVFHYIPDIEFYVSWDNCKEELLKEVVLS